MKHIFVLGSKGIPANYGGFETFVDKLVSGKKSSEITYHVTCLADNNSEFYYNHTHCMNIYVKKIGAATAVLYDLLSLRRCIDYIRKNNIEDATIYILACRIGPFIKWYSRILGNLGIKFYLNPDGHEWKRSKWNKFIKMYWKYSEKNMVKYSNLVICDSIGIKDYIDEEYKSYSPSTVFIPYGADLRKKQVLDKLELDKWLKMFSIDSEEYYLIVGRFVPENNYELMIKEFMNSKTKKDLVIITNYSENKFYQELLNKTKFNKDKRIKFVGTVYDQNLLTQIRENAYAYLHGHEVGGTNPSLLEAMATTKINILFDVVFNREVGLNSAIYFNKVEGNLAKVINSTDNMSMSEIETLAKNAKERIELNYSWGSVIEKYENKFIN